jgi:hypothetical protein
MLYARELAMTQCRRLRIWAAVPMRALLLVLYALINLRTVAAEIRVFVALADNKTQGIVPVPPKIGDGDDAQHNLYWGCDEALPVVLRGSKDWTLASRKPGAKPSVIESVTFEHQNGSWRLIADAYRGSAIRECIGDFIQTLSSERPREELPLVAYIGHNGLMDFSLPDEILIREGPGRDAIVLCCMSERYFTIPLAKVRARPVLTTTQLMYPGGFLLRDALAGWTRGEAPRRMRERAAAAYSRNQGISLKAALGVFSELK